MRVLPAVLLAGWLVLPCSTSLRSAVSVPGDGLRGSALRPQLSDLSAAHDTVLVHLARAGNIDQGLVTDEWDPTAGVGDVSAMTADFEVGGGSSFATVQAAIDAAVAGGGHARRHIEVYEGTYREVVCVPAHAPPITLYTRNPDASKTSIVFDNYSGKPLGDGARPNPCSPSADNVTIGTRSTATFASLAPEFRAKNLSFVNDADESTAVSRAVQGVALSVLGDRSSFENVRVLGNQDSLFLSTPDVGTVTRMYLSRCYVEGDTDFIFGRATAVLDACTIHTLTTRKPDAVILAPSTDCRVLHGLLVNDCTFTADAGAATSSIHLGRAWDEGQVDVATYARRVDSGIYPNGQALVRGSRLGAHIQSDAPWRAAATTARPYSSSSGALPANRLYEFQNTGAGSAP